MRALLLLSLSLSVFLSVFLSFCWRFGLASPALHWTASLLLLLTPTNPHTHPPTNQPPRSDKELQHLENTGQGPPPVVVDAAAAAGGGGPTTAPLPPGTLGKGGGGSSGGTEKPLAALSASSLRRSRSAMDALVNEKDGDGRTPLHYAARWGDMEVRAYAWRGL